MTHLPFEQRRFLIIGGTSKAGTSALYRYLEQHPEVTPSLKKEVNYFLDPDDSEPSITRYAGDIASYAANFPDDADVRRVCLEASPGYLYARGAAQAIHEHLPNAQVLFILREPVSRLLSWYRFARQIGEIGDIDVETFVRQQLDGRGAVRPNYLEQGLYARYLRPYFDLLGPERTRVVFFETLQSDPLQLMRQVCAHAGISAQPFDDYRFEVVNRTLNMRSVRLHKAYLQSVKRLSVLAPRAYVVFRKAWQHVKPWYLKLNSRPDQGVSLPDALRAELAACYAPDREALAALGCEPPW